MRNFSLCIILLIISGIGCKKYSEDGKRYLFKSPMKRITGHTWKIKQLTINGIDSTERIYTLGNTAAVSYRFKEVEVKFRKKEYTDNEPMFPYRYCDVTPKSIGFMSAWDFSGNKDKLVFFLDMTDQSYNTFKLNSKHQLWNILTLTEKEMKIETIEDYRKISLKFEL